MKINKKILTALIVVGFTLSACGGNDKETTKKDNVINDERTSESQTADSVLDHVDGVELVDANKIEAMKIEAYGMGGESPKEGKSVVYPAKNPKLYVPATVQRETDTYILYNYDKIEVDSNGNYLEGSAFEEYHTQDNTSMYDVYLGNGESLDGFISKSSKEQANEGIFIFEKDGKLYKFELMSFNILHSYGDKYVIKDDKVFAPISVFDNATGEIDDEYQYDLIVQDKSVRKEMMNK
ncbi:MULTISPECIES: hypothetical protein [unclassified Breznakia]|uniref:hypothetical protein n=1 Tax=unclassified Breznakia TaxID=2623764 RepID=UPI002474B911|nr:MULTISPECIES: hypothetical protein [unclassified Breznakia]MDH6367241.1 hypothetical protein [Breznakia sp. PH1-1]MDH6404420.1 hypothetical protein [Breznakia sp. PF1-11]MDH6412189.1 hypothetical protein [Breznakia sp. PFB1-11]MDH6414408.1 hypothetical protein [Breznakia sp. PFB1-14]MDH6416793.1 hypothetical protein [Breznakia sp. PFB1-4]